MPSTTSGTTTFSLDVDELIDQALDDIGGEYTTGYDMVKARRTLNILLIELQNKNIPLNKLDFVTQALTVNTAAYTLNAAYVDVLEASVVNTADDTANEIPLTKMGVREYQQLPKKDMSNRPNTYVLERRRDALRLTVWPVPNLTTFELRMLVSKRIEDITAAYQKLDLPYRYLPLIKKWLSFELARTRQGIPDNIIARLEKAYLDAMPDTFDEDRERVDMMITPGGISGR